MAESETPQIEPDDALPEQAPGDPSDFDAPEDVEPVEETGEDDA
jgi:hypothetical protein